MYKPTSTHIHTHAHNIKCKRYTLQEIFTKKHKKNLILRTLTYKNEGCHTDWKLGV